MIKKIAWMAALLLPMAAGAQEAWPSKATGTPHLVNKVC